MPRVKEAKIARFVPQTAFDDVDGLFGANRLDFDLGAGRRPVGIFAKLKIHRIAQMILSFLAIYRQFKIIMGAGCLSSRSSGIEEGPNQTVRSVV